MLLLLTVSYYDIHLNRFKYDGIWLCEKESIKQTNKQTEEKRIKNLFSLVILCCGKKKFPTT